ncbi:MAG: S41 family peptidase [Magnetovibrionaceae bacterium]
MSAWRRGPQTLLFVIGLGLSAMLVSSLSGCSGSTGPMQSFLRIVGLEAVALENPSSAETARFVEVYEAYADQSTPSKIKHFNDAFKRVRLNSVRTVPDKDLIDAAIKAVQTMEEEPGSIPGDRVVEIALDGMLDSLDAHSDYLTPQEYQEMQVSTRGEFGGLGIEITLDGDFVRVVAPIEDTPAYRAGIQAGDLITHLDGDSIKGQTLAQAVRTMRGRPGTSIRLTIEREGRTPFDVPITRAIVQVQAVRYNAEGSVGYIRIRRFSEKLEDGILEAVADLKREIGPGISGFVIDLRNNPGGLLTQSIILSDAFLEEGRVVSVRGRPGTSERVYSASSGDLLDGLPMVVLINRGSASASEIVARALQDHGRALVMGQRSFGKGSVQTITPLPEEGALKLTTQLFYGPSGHAIQALGVQPDIIIEPADVPEEGADAPREADLPGALDQVEADFFEVKGTVSESSCPVAGEREDRMLGCALELLKAGTPAKFLSDIGKADPSAI